MNASLNRKSLLFGVPGIILQIGGFVASEALSPEADPNLTAALLCLVIQLAGTGLLLAGLAYYAMAKGRHPAWCLFAFLSIIGLIVLALLKDKSVAQAPPQQPAGPA